VPRPAARPALAGPIAEIAGAAPGTSSPFDPAAESGTYIAVTPSGLPAIGEMDDVVHNPGLSTGTVDNQGLRHSGASHPSAT